MPCRSKQRRQLVLSTFAGRLVLPVALTDMLAALTQGADDRGQAELLKRFGRTQLDMPDAAAQLSEETETVTESGAREENLTQLMSASLDEARMARENGQKRGAAFIGASRTPLGHRPGVLQGHPRGFEQLGVARQSG
jgi:hypothetical protein